VPSTKRTLRTLLTKPGWNALEVRTLRGVLSALDRPRGPQRAAASDRRESKRSNS
jgi:tRNA C32,U32 (ribose-2'-O)-methylase TrmJ